MTAVERLDTVAALVVESLVLKPDDADASPSDLAALTRAMERGDEPAWVRFHEQYSARLHRYLLVVARGDEAAAAEALQLTFTRVARHIRTFDREDVFWSWLTVLARSAAVDEARKQRRRDGFFARLRAQPPSPADPSAAEAASRLRAALETGLADLPAEERRVVERKYLEGAAVRDIAAELGATEKAVESRLRRARLRLKQTILTLLRHETE